MNADFFVASVLLISANMISQGSVLGLLRLFY